MVYELRIYSMEPGSFGSVVRSRQVKAPHCITSIQFSPTSEHLLIAYGRCASDHVSGGFNDYTLQPKMSNFQLLHHELLVASKGL